MSYYYIKNSLLPQHLRIGTTKTDLDYLMEELPYTHHYDSYDTSYPILPSCGIYNGIQKSDLSTNKTGTIDDSDYNDKHTSAHNIILHHNNRDDRFKFKGMFPLFRTFHSVKGLPSITSPNTSVTGFNSPNNLLVRASGNYLYSPVLNGWLNQITGTRIPLSTDIFNSTQRTVSEENTLRAGFIGPLSGNGKKITAWIANSATANWYLAINDGSTTHNFGKKAKIYILLQAAGGSGENGYNNQRGGGGQSGAAVLVMCDLSESSTTKKLEISLGRPGDAGTGTAASGNANHSYISYGNTTITIYGGLGGKQNGINTNPVRKGAITNNESDSFLQIIGIGVGIIGNSVSGVNCNSKRINPGIYIEQEYNGMSGIKVGDKILGLSNPYNSNDDYDQTAGGPSIFYTGAVGAETRDANIGAGGAGSGWGSWGGYGGRGGPAWVGFFY